ncbi:MAG: SurA N-terminal domain-containing protein [Burkholderiales bacterium]
MFGFVGKYKKISWVIFGLIIASFALFGVQSYFTGGSADSVANVGKSSISQQEFGYMVEREQERLRPQVQQNPQAAQYLQSDDFKRSVLNNMIQRRLILNAARSSGLAVSEDELIEMISTVGAFQDENGKFSHERYEQVLKAQRLSTAEFEEQVSEDVIVGRLQRVIAETAFVPNVTVKNLVRQRLQEREVSQLVFSPADYREAMVVSDVDVKKYYDDNQNLFRIPERAKLEYVVLNDEVASASVVVSEQDLQEAYEARIADYQSKEQRRASHILISVTDNTDDSQWKKAKEKVDSVLTKVKANPKNFSALAKEFSNDPGSAENGGDLGLFEKGFMVKEFEDAAFGAKIGEIVGPVKTEYGYHIIRVDEVKGGQTANFDSIKEDLEKEIRKARADEAYLKASQTFTDLVYTEFDSLQPVADNLKLTIQKSDWVGRDSGGFNPMLNNPDLLTAVFSPEVLEEKRNTQAFEVQPGVLVAARVVEHALEEGMKFEDVASDIKDFMKSERSLAKAKEAGEAALAKLKSGEKVSGDWSKPGVVTLVNRQGLHAEGLSAVFGMNRTALPGYAGLVNEDGRYVIYRVTKVTDKEDEVEGQLEAGKRQITSMTQQQQGAQYLNSLREKANVRIKTDLFKQ